MAQLVGMRTTYQSDTTENRRVRHIDEKIALLEPDVAPLITLLNRMDKRRAITSTTHEWMEDDYTARWVKNSTTTIANTTSATTFTAIDGTLVTEGDILAVPDGTSGVIGEYMRVSTTSSNVVTVVRNWNGHGIVSLNASAHFRLIGTAHHEGSGIPVMKNTSPATKTTYLQIFKRVIDFSNTQIAQKTYGAQNGGERKRQQAKNLLEFKEQLNAALLWSKAYASGTGIVGGSSKPIRQTMGLNSVISTNSVDANGTLTPRLFETFARQVFRYGSKKKILLATGVLVSAINEWGTKFMQVSPGETKYGVSVRNILTGHGEFMLVRDWMLENPATGSGFGGLAFALDLDQLEYLYLSGNGENRDTRLEMDVVQDGTDAKRDQIIGEIGFAVKMEQFHGKLYNITGYSA